MRDLAAEDFPAFFRAVHNEEPFFWQKELALDITAGGAWPPLVDMPTGAGKTAAIDIAVFHLALEAGRSGRRAPVRILYVIDRRLVVDAAFERAKTIAAALAKSEDGVLASVAARLRTLSGSGPPLAVVRLRGGVPQERDWARSPAQPLVAVSTVDQVGSRLLFRGYGVSRKMLPVHAGLVGADALWLLDEVHLSRPFEQTLDAIAAVGPRRLAPFAVVKLSATPGAERPGGWFPGPGRDVRRRDEKSFNDRLTGTKRAMLVAAGKDEAGTFVTHALRFAGIGTGEDVQPTPVRSRRGRGRKREPQAETVPRVRRVAVVVNRVDLARRIFERIRAEAGEKADVFLLTGRVRPLDASRILERIAGFRAGRERPEPEKPIILVATQTIEVGADLDVDALVTEIAPLDSLRQRVGRLDRLGLRQESQAVIIHPPGRPAKARDNPWAPVSRIYGEAAHATKAFLEGLGGEVDFGTDAMQHRLSSLASGDLEKMLAPRPRAPTLLPPYVDLWSTTSPPPPATPEPALFLHGPQVSAEVHVVWRAGVSPDNMDTAKKVLESCPPSSLEAMPVPVWAVRKWLQEGKPRPQPVADVLAAGPEDERGLTQVQGRRVIRRDEEDDWVGAGPDDVRPGDLIVVPVTYGGCDEWGWSVGEARAVRDLGIEAHYLQRRRGAVMFTKETVENALLNSPGGELPSEVWGQVQAVISGLDDDVNGEEVREALAVVVGLPESWQKILAGMEGRKPIVGFLDEDQRDNGFTIFAEKQLAPGLLELRREEEAETGEESTTDWEEPVGEPVPLGDHLGHVGQRAQEFAFRAGLDGHLADLLALAGRMHDLGKADPRFQADLRGAGALARMDPALVSALTSDLLAKSGRGAYRRGRGIQAAPKNFRHEALSVALAGKHPEIATLSEDERDLVLWLIGTHHGYGRPFFPACRDPAPGTKTVVDVGGTALKAEAGEAPLRLDQGWFERAARLRRRFNPWDLAWLEAVLRLADHSASAEEDKGGRPAR